MRRGDEEGRRTTTSAARLQTGDKSDRGGPCNRKTMNVMNVLGPKFPSGLWWFVGGREAVAGTPLFPEGEIEPTLFWGLMAWIGVAGLWGMRKGRLDG